MLDVKRLKEKITRSHLSCLDCYHFDRSEQEIIYYSGKRIRFMRGCTNYRHCHKGGYKSLGAER